MKQEKISCYEEAVDYLLRTPRFTAKNSPEDTRAYLHSLGDPDRKMHMIHVAGTNGKGSVCAYLCSILEASGKKVAMFTSPHLVDIRERFIINGEMAGKEEFLSAFLRIYNSLDWEALEQGEGYHPTFFEYLFFMAMLIFERHKPDYCILETGLGGRLDATNSVSHKELCVITAIGLDHVELLGGTVGEIAGEKAGIMRRGTPVVYADTSPEASGVIREHAARLQIPAFPVSKFDYANLKFNNKNIDFSLESRYYGYIRLTLRTSARYQAENAMLAVRAIEALDQGRAVTGDMLKAGLERCFWPGRMEEVLPRVYVDGAHNEDGVRAFLDTVRYDGFDGRRSLLFSAVREKDLDHMLRLMVSEGLFSFIAIARLHSGRAADLMEMEKVMKKYPGIAYTLFEDTQAALRELLARQEEGRIYAAGSLYLVGEIKELLNHDKFRRRAEEVSSQPGSGGRGGSYLQSGSY